MSRNDTRSGARSLRRLAALTAATAGLAGAGLFAAGSAQAANTGIPVLEAIKQCESGGNYTATNPASTASGAYQFLDTTWRSLSSSAGYARAKDAPAAVQDAAAIQLYRAQGTTPWVSSQSCWGPLAGSAATSGGTSTGTGAATGSGTSSGAAGATTHAPARTSGSARNSAVTPRTSPPADAAGARRPADVAHRVVRSSGGHPLR